MANNKAWTDEMKSELKRMVMEGMSYRDIGERLGVTRNAISGAVMRYCPWPERPVPALSKPADAPKRVRKYVRADKFKPRPAYLVAAVPDGPMSKNPRTIFQLSDETCRWPISGERDAMLFCGDKPFGAYPYCIGHCRMAYSSAAQWERENAEAIEVDAGAPLEAKPVKEAA